MGIDVDLLFHPVGQGMFASGHLKRANSSGTEFSWIYDCGSVSAGRLEISAVNRLAAHLGGVKPRIDLLVISHFDHDHISGIPHLLSTFDVKRILIPLVPLWARLTVVSQLGLSITSAEQSLILDPVGTLSALPEGDAPEEIVIVPQTGGDERPPPWEPEGLPDEPSFDIHVEKDNREQKLEAFPGYGPVAAGSQTQVVQLRKSGRITVGSLWEFVPYNDSLSIAKATPALVSQASVLSSQLLSATSQQARAAVLAAIKNLYHTTFLRPESRNRLSLFMYAGASQKLHRTHQDFNGYWRAYPGLPPTPDRRGVLYTGDGTLKAKKAWAELDRFMGSQRLAHLIAMQVMHHGSKSNWHKGLAGKINPETSVFPADRHYQYRHPDGAVWDDFASYSVPILVDTRTPCHLTQRFS